jgi:hypothetical protein
MEQYDAAKGRQPHNPGGEFRKLPVDLDIRDAARHDYEIERCVTPHLVGDADLAASRIFGRGNGRHRDNWRLLISVNTTLVQDVVGSNSESADTIGIPAFSHRHVC